MRQAGNHWLNRERLKVYPRILVAMFLLAGIVYSLTFHDLVDSSGRPPGTDFITFWAASHLGLSGQAVDAYSIPALLEAQRVAVPAVQSVYAWFYPPAFLLVVLPLALLPYLPSLVVFVGATLAGYLAVLARVVRRLDAVWMIAAFPGIWLCLAHGQNGFLTATLAAAALLLLDRRPVAAGVLIGLLAIKPHLAVLFPLALIAGGSWTALVVAGVTAATFIGLGTAVFGLASLQAWLSSMGLARVLVEQGGMSWESEPTTFGLLRILGAPVGVSYVAHGVVGVLAAIAVWRVWRRVKTLPLRGAVLMTGTFLVSPYSFHYDLVWLAFPIAWLALEGMREGWLRGEREVLVAAWALPMYMTPLAVLTHVQIGPVVLGTLLWVIVRRAFARPGTLSPDAAPSSASDPGGPDGAGDAGPAVPRGRDH